MMFPDLVEVKSVKAGGHLKFGVPKEAIYKMLPDPDRYMLFVLAMDRNQYRGVQESMQQEEAAIPMSKVREMLNEMDDTIECVDVGGSGAFCGVPSDKFSAIATKYGVDL